MSQQVSTALEQSKAFEQSQVDHRQHIAQRYLETRERSLQICAPLETEDYVIQTMPDVSPPKWHLAHTSWFFETFLLSVFDTSYHCYHPQYDTLFNSYYVTHSDPYPRPARGLLSRPTVDEVMTYRAHIDRAMMKLIQGSTQQQWSKLSPLITLGINHEQQHQELLLTDIKHILSLNPLQPAYRKMPAHSDAIAQQVAAAELPSAEPTWLTIKGGVRDVGYTHEQTGFAFDNESPAHKVYFDDFKLASRCVNNREYLEFIEDDGYRRPELWLSDGWSVVQDQHWQAPLYWQQQDQAWTCFTFEGVQPVDLDAPVCHVSYFEADAYASWKQKRLPKEHEWELAARQMAVNGNFYEQQQYRPLAPSPTHDQSIQQLFGDIWEWTASPYTAYPGYRPAAGSIGEYNGKFMSGQMVLRGGSFASAQDHLRATYRNFFYAKDRWQFSGIRLADDV